MAQEVENARIFRETFQSNRASEGDYVLLGDIISTRYEGKVFSYGFSIYAPYLWLLDLPAATHSSELELRLRLAKTPSDPPIWTYTITGSTSQTSRIYAMKSDFEYDTMLKDGMRGALESLRQAAQGLPAAEPTAVGGEPSSR